MYFNRRSFFSFCFLFFFFWVNFRFADCSSLADLKKISAEEYNLGVSERKENVRKELLKEPCSLSTTTLCTKAGEEFNFSAVVVPVLEHLQEEEDPDFHIIQLVRLMYANSSTIDIILPYMLEVPLWVNLNERLRVYWSENHMLMYLSSRLLLQQLLGDDVFYPTDETLREKIVWFLNLKIESGFYEFYSHYLRFTLASLLNLHDLSNDEEIVELSKKAIVTLMNEFVGCFNSAGFCGAAAGRAIPKRYGKLFKRTSEHVISHMLLGTQLDPFERHFVVAAFVDSEIDISEVRTSFNLVDSVTRKIGHTHEEFIEKSSDLSKEDDRIVAQMTLGGYAHPDYVKDSLTLVDEFRMWDHRNVKDYNFAQYVPTNLYRPFSQMLSTVTRGSLLSAEYQMWKNDAASLSSMDNYYPGFRGYQQLTWVATTGDLATWTNAVDSSTIQDADDIDNYKMNYQLPMVVQEDNMALIMYNPNADLKYLLNGNIDVVFYFDESSYDEVVKHDKWIIACRNESYVAVHRHCVGEKFGTNESLSVCHDSKQIWAVMVGNKATHFSFSNFTEILLESSEIEADFGSKCIYARVTSGGKEIGNKFCRSIGNVNRAIIGIVLIIIGLIVAIIIMWKFSLASRTRKVIVRRMSQGSQVLSRKLSVGSEILTRRVSRAASTSLRKLSVGSKSERKRPVPESEAELQPRSRNVTFDRNVEEFEIPDDASLQSELKVRSKRSVTFDDTILRQEENKMDLA